MKKAKKEIPEDLQFSDRERKVFSLFWKKGFYVDVPIDEMFCAYRGLRKLPTGLGEGALPRTRQMAIGMVVTLINRKLSGTRIEPGALKRTYRLVHTKNL